MLDIKYMFYMKYKACFFPLAISQHSSTISDKMTSHSPLGLSDHEQVHGAVFLNNLIV